MMHGAVDIHDIWITQRSLKRIEQIPEIVKQLRQSDYITLDDVEIPPITLFYVQDRFVLNDGHHRLFSLYMANRRMLYFNDERMDVVVCDMNSARKPLKQFKDWWPDQYLRLVAHMGIDHLPENCTYSRKYKGLVPPKCHNGTGCQECWKIYRLGKQQ